jgi:uncharacterized protein (DUF2062 family)
MARKLAKALMHKFEEFSDVPVLRPFARYLAHPALWSLHRRSVALGVACGLFCGLIPGPLQIVSAAVVAVIFKFNFPVAVVTTLYTNPLTIVPLYLLAYQLGALLTGAPPLAQLDPPPELNLLHPLDAMRAFGEWAWNLGMPLFVGVPALAAVLAASGYLIVRVAWSAYLRRAWARRKAARAARAQR